jgi:hypothetical protein
MKDHAHFLLLLVIIGGLVFFANFLAKKGKLITFFNFDNLDETQKNEQKEIDNGDDYTVNENKEIDNTGDPVGDLTNIFPFEREGVLQISSVSLGGDDRPTRINLRSNLKEGEILSITDWKIRTNSNYFLIPEVVNYYVINEDNKRDPVILNPGDNVIIYVGEKSPVNNNFRLNKCLGYLNDRVDLYSSINNECPLPERDDYKNFSGECQNVIRSFRRCELPDVNEMNTIKFSDSNECRDYIYNFFNIKNCYDTYKNDENFLDNELWLWINRSGIFDPHHDWVRIENTQGKVIDEYSY